eukprot:scaffold10723_cov164-Amphora_coffeaeformis.AAC.15
MGRFGSFVAPHTVAFFDRQRGTAPKRVKRRHAGGIGFADFCESNLGERVLLNELCKDVATEIAVYVPNVAFPAFAPAFSCFVKEIQ